MEIRPQPSRAQLRQRASHALLTHKAIAKRKRRRKLGQALALPTDKARLRKLAHSLTIGKLK